ncbi:MAG: hypothetical protein KKG00_13800 [Bacteroidetes bacterium]|nr:hypothetical protein [Bacteroidota bacterium]
MLINSGGFSFRFEETFFRSRSKPWPLIPIWTSKEETGLACLTNTDFGKSSVSFALRPKDETILKVDQPDKPSYKTSLLSVFSDERVLLFLRNVEQVVFFHDGQKVICEKEGFNWWRYSFQFRVDAAQRNFLNREIERENEKIPEKFKDIEQAEISFATRRKGIDIQSVENDVLFAYLPTRISLGLPFLINSDFIPDGSREGLHDLEWNSYLLAIAGQKFPEWLRKIGQWNWTDKNGAKQKFNTDFIKLIPDFESTSIFPELLSSFKSGFDSAITKVAFIPDRNGDLKRLEEVLIDTTGLIDLTGPDLFLELCDEKRSIVKLDKESTRKLTHLIKEHGEGRIFDKVDLSDLIDTEVFQKWLREPSQNIGFLKLVSKKGWLDSFNDQPIFLDQNGELHQADDLWYDLSDDLSLLAWLNPLYLHPEVRQEVSIIGLPIALYTASDFIQRNILGRSSEVDSALDQKANNLNFYRYLFKHRNQLSPDYFSKGKLHWFKVWGRGDEEYISSFQDGLSLYVYNPVLGDLLIKGVFPADHFYLLSPDFSEKAEDQQAWTKFWQEKFGVNQYSPATFMQEEILAVIDQLNNHFDDYEPFDDKPAESYQQRQLASVHLWQYIAKILPDLPVNEQKQARLKLKELVVFTTFSGKTVPLYQCFLPVHYTGNSTIEELAKEYVLSPSPSFVAESYLADQSLTPKKWRELFRDCHAREDEYEVINQSLLPNLSGFSENKLLDATRLIFKHRSHFENQLERLAGLKVKTISGDWIEPKEAILGATYTGVDYLDIILPTVQQNNIVSSNYSSDKQISEWHRFFENLGVISLATEASVISHKIGYLLTNQVTLNTQETNITLVIDLLELHQQEKLTKEHYEKLQELQLLTSGTKMTLLPAKQCHLASVYKPYLDLERLLSDSERPDIFVSPFYQQTSSNVLELKDFFIKIGVYDNFRLINKANANRAEINSAYLRDIELMHPYIANDAINWSRNHSLDLWIEINYQSFIEHFAVSEVFWKEVSDNRFSAKLFQQTTYRCGNRVFSVVNYATRQFQTISCIPTLAGTCANAQSLFSYRFKEYINDKSLIPAFDLTQIFIDDETIESKIGIRQELALRFYIRRVEETQNHQFLKQEGIWDEIITILAQKPLRLEAADETAYRQFIKTGSLPNQRGEWQHINELHYIADEFKPGLGRYAGLIHNDLVKLAPSLSVKALTRKDFQFKLNGDERTESFKEHLTERLKYVAFAENQANWDELLEEYCQKVFDFTFWRTKQIVYSFGEGETAIKSTEENFLEDGGNIYYVGNWREYRAGRLFNFIYRTLGLTISEKQLTDFLLYEDVVQIVDFFEERGHPVPAEWKPKSVSSPIEKNIIAESDTPQRTPISDRSEEELAEKGGRTEAERISDNKEAKYAVRDWLTNNGFKYSENMFNYDEIEGVVRIADGAMFSVLVSSVKEGKLYFSPVKWLKMDAVNTFLLVVGSGNKVTPFYSHKDVLKKYARTLLRVDNRQVDPDGLSAIADLHTETKSFQFVFYDAEDKFDVMFNNQISLINLNGSGPEQTIEVFGDIL